MLGQSWLVRRDYLLDYRNHSPVVDGAAPEGGVRTALRSPDGRPAVVAEVNGRRQELILDSGAQLAVLFERPAPVRHVLLLTHTDSVAAEGCSVTVAIGDGYSRRMAAAKVSASRPSTGLFADWRLQLRLHLESRRSGRADSISRQKTPWGKAKAARNSDPTVLYFKV